MNDSVRSAGRVLDLLEHLASLEGEGAALTSVAAVFGLPKSSALALLRTLVRRGYATRDAHGLYRLNESFRRHGFGWGGDPKRHLMAVAQPVMDALCQSLGETVLLGALDDDGRVRFLAKSVASAAVRYDVDLDEVNQAYCMAIGRVLLAHQPAARRNAILSATPRVKRTPRTVVALETIRKEIERVRQQGFCIIDEEFAQGGVGIAMPVFDRDGHVVAALDVGYVSSRFAGKRDVALGALRAAIDSLPAPFCSGAPALAAALPGASGPVPQDAPQP